MRSSLEKQITTGVDRAWALAGIFPTMEADTPVRLPLSNRILPWMSQKGSAKSPYFAQSKGRIRFLDAASTIKIALRASLPQQQCAEGKDSATGKEQHDLSSLYDSRHQSVHHRTSCENHRSDKHLQSGWHPTAAQLTYRI